MSKPAPEILGGLTRGRHVAWYAGERVLLPGLYRDCPSLGLLTSLIPETMRKLAPPMAVHACLQLSCVGILHVSDRRFLHSSHAHNYTERPLEAQIIHKLWSAGSAERPPEGAPKRRGNARHPTTASRLARSASEGWPWLSPRPSPHARLLPSERRRHAIGGTTPRTTKCLERADKS